MAFFKAKVLRQRKDGMYVVYIRVTQNRKSQYIRTSWIVDDGVRWQPTASISANTWYHICIIRKKEIGKFLYINGVLDKETTATGTPTTVSTTNYSIGASQNTSSTVSDNYFVGYSSATASMIMLFPAPVSPERTSIPE